MVHIEFNGLPGSGKTMLYHKANAFLEQKLGYKPGPDQVWTKMLRDPTLQAGVIKEVGTLKAFQLRLSRMFRGARFIPPRIRYWTVSTVSEEEITRASNYERLKQFIVDYREYFYRVLEAYPVHKYAEEWDEKYLYLNLEYFLILATHYQSYRMDPGRTWIMYDEGFYRDAVKYVVDDEGVAVEQGKELLACAPKVDVLFYVETDIDTCVSRMKGRSAGVPPPYRKFERENGLHDALARDMVREEGFARYLEETGSHVVRIDNNRPPEASFAEIASELERLYQHHSHHQSID